MARSKKRSSSGGAAPETSRSSETSLPEPTNSSGDVSEPATTAELHSLPQPSHDDITKQVAELLMPSGDDAANGTVAPDPEPGVEQLGQPPESEEGAEESVAPAPTSLTELAEKLDTDPAELYSLEISVGDDGEKVTLGTLKDAYQDREQATRESAQRESQLDERESVLLNEQRIWGELGETLAQSIPQDQTEKIKQHLAQRDERERAALLRAVPEFDDPAKFEKFREGALELLTEFGYKPHEIQVSDHRRLLEIRDHMRVKQRLKKLLEFEPKPKQPAQRKQKGREQARSNTSAAVERATRADATEAEKVAGVAALLSGG